MRFHRALFMIAAVIAIGCSSNSDTPPSLAGSYHATILRVTPSGASPTDFLAAGVTLAITINSTGATSGSVTFPTSITGGAAVTEDMAGTATLSGTTVHFTQSADTFVRDLAWTLNSASLSVTSQVANGSAYTVTLARQ